MSVHGRDSRQPGSRDRAAGETQRNRRPKRTERGGAAESDADTLTEQKRAPETRQEEETEVFLP